MARRHALAHLQRTVGQPNRQDIAQLRVQRICLVWGELVGAGGVGGGAAEARPAAAVVTSPAESHGMQVSEHMQCHHAVMPSRGTMGAQHGSIPELGCSRHKIEEEHSRPCDTECDLHMTTTVAGHTRLISIHRSLSALSPVSHKLEGNGNCQVLSQVDLRLAQAGGVVDQQSIIIGGLAPWEEE